MGYIPVEQTVAIIEATKEKTSPLWQVVVVSITAIATIIAAWIAVRFRK